METTINQLETLRQQHEAAKLQLEVAQFEAAQAMLGSARRADLTEAWGDLIDPLDWLSDDPSFGRPLLPSGQIGDRTDGKNVPVFQSEQELAAIRATARLLCDTSPTAICALRNLTNFVIGTGFAYKVVPQPGASEQLVAAVQSVVDQFLDDNDWVGDLERELFIRSRRDGEFFVALYDVGGGRTQVRMIEPEQVTEPDNPRSLEDYYGFERASNWSFGIHTEANDVQAVHGYYVQWNATGTDWDYLPAAKVEHFKINVDRNIKRGLSDFYAVRGHLERAEKLLRNTSEGAAIQAAIAFVREHIPGVTQGQIESMRSTAATSTYTQHTQSGSRTKYVQKYEPGTILDVAKGQQYKPGPMGSSRARNFVEIEQALLRTIGTRWCMPEYLISGDASNANYASTMVAESPFVKNAQAEQRYYAKGFRRIIRKALAIATQAGRFNRFGVGSGLLGQLVNVQVEPPRVAVRDAEKETSQRKLLHDAGLLSKQTWSAQEGLDFAQQQALRNSR